MDSIDKIIFILTDIPIMIVLSVFIISMIFCIKKYTEVNKNLRPMLKFLQTFSKNDLNYRFKEIDRWMSTNPYVSSTWAEFKNTLVFSESIALQGSTEEEFKYEEVSSTIQYLQTTVDPAYFFNEETLVLGKYNSKLIATIPTILTGCGPLFTFLKIALAFGGIDFSTQEKTIASISGLMSNMQIAALVSVFAVGSSLIFLVFEKLAYAILCKSVLEKIEVVIGNLFDNVSSEKFLFELLKETKIQNNSLYNLLSSSPEKFKVAMNTSIAGNLVPYLENLIFGLNQMNKQLKENAKIGRSGDSVDDLF